MQIFQEFNLLHRTARKYSTFFKVFTVGLKPPDEDEVLESAQALNLADYACLLRWPNNSLKNYDRRLRRIKEILEAEIC